MHHRRSGSSSLFMSTPLLILLLLIFSLAFIFFALSSLNKTWDSFNVFRVLFAMILCVVFARQNDDESCTSYQQHAFTAAVLAPSDAYANWRITEEEGGYVSHQWFGSSFYESEEGMGNICYHTPPIPLQPLATDQVTVNHRTRRAGVVEEEEEEDNVKEIPMDDFENRSPTQPPLPKSPAPLPPTPTPPPSPPPPQPANVESEDRSRKSEKMKSGVKKEIAMVWASVLSNQKKRKKQQRKKAILNHDSDNLLHTSSELPKNTRAPPPPSPPLPPPPPPSVFRSLLKKGRLCRGNRVHSVSAPTPRRRKTMPAVNTCNQLPLIPVPQPPPPLAFKLSAMEDVDADVKAAACIARLKDEWKLQKLKSMKEKANFSRPCVGPGPFPLRGFNL